MIGDYSINPDDLLVVIDSILDENGLVSHHIESANELYNMGLEQIITQVFEIKIKVAGEDIKKSTEEDNNIERLEAIVNFSNVVIERPKNAVRASGNKRLPTYPNEALAMEKTYQSVLNVDVNIKVVAIMKNGPESTKEGKAKDIRICKIPIMVKSKWCNTYEQSKESLVRRNEDPTDPGGYFIIRGIEWSIDCVENILFNKVRIYKNEGYQKEFMRAEFISKPGDHYLNSDQLIIRWLNDGQISMEVGRDKLKEINIPFYLVFRIMGWNTDKLIFNNILYRYDTPTSKKMYQYLVDAFKVKYNDLSDARYIYEQHYVLMHLAKDLRSRSPKMYHYLDLDNKPENYQIITNSLLETFDKYFLQSTGIGENSREMKMRFICLLIRKMFLVHLGSAEPTDRDSFNSKRIHSAGMSYAKIFKTNFNATIVQPMRHKISNALKNTPFNQLNLVNILKNSIYGSNFEQSITRAITAGNKSQVTVNNKMRINRLSSQLLNRKNQLNVYSTLRQVSATVADSSKQSERASEMRRVHMSALAYICVIHSPEGDKVGINKQLALSAFITKASSGVTLKEKLLEDNEIYPLIDVDFGQIATGLNNVFVNGDWIGCCDDALYIAKKYRIKRRALEINPEVSIVWDPTQDEVNFWADAGRIIRPLLIVYNNQRDAAAFKGKGKKTKFFQGLAITQQHINDLFAKKINRDYLLKNKIIEYISADEQENTYICPDFHTLVENKTNILKEYTHCDIPQAMLGFTALTSPYSSHNQAQRIVYQTSQSKQTCGNFAKNWPFRMDKDTFLQYNNEVPLVKTLSNKYLYPNGSNTVVAIMCNTGYNIEDSIIMNQSAIDRGLFNGCKFTFYKTELEPHEEFANPDTVDTTEMKSAYYGKLVDGIIKEGTVINKDDAIIGKKMKLTKDASDKYQYIDRSIIYKEDEPAVVFRVIVAHNEEGKVFCKVVLRKLRPVANGDKFSVRGTSQVLTNSGWKEIQNIDITKDKVATLTLEGNLDYVYPSGLSKYEYDGDMYSLKTQQVEMFVTKNHKLYVKRRDKTEFELLTTDKVFGKRVRFKKWANNVMPDIAEYDAKSVTGTITSYPMDAWLKLLGIFIADVSTDNDTIQLHASKQRKRDFHYELLDELDVFYSTNKTRTRISGSKYPAIHNEMRKLSVGALNKRLPDYVWELSQRQSKILLDALIEGDGHIRKKNGTTSYTTSSIGLADDIQRLTLHAGLSANIGHGGHSKGDKYQIFKDGKLDHEGTYNADSLQIGIIRRCNEPQINHSMVKKQNGQEEKYVNYKGTVYCLEIPDGYQHVYYSKESFMAPACWSGNSSRSGQKGTIGLALRDSDMPFTEEGIKPSIIINPHSIPSRMTIGQLIESLVGTLCAEKGAHVDATIFKKVDIESIALELESMGLNKYGYRRLYNGITGEFIDAEIFIGVTYYQRLQKFTADTIYGVVSGPSDAITGLPLDGGKSSNGGLRIGEMERDVYAAHGASKSLSEKFFDHSDGYKEYVCRCGKPAIVNVQMGIYDCEYCKDNADIIGYNTSWTAKLLNQVINSMGIGTRRYPEPFTYARSGEDVFDIIDANRSDAL
jgi:DNA-directed RNA polymerase beta subunit